MSAKYWLDQLDKATKHEKKFREQAQKVLDRYIDERNEYAENDTKFGILWANTETMRPALISDVPVPEARGRFRKNDPIVRTAATIIERAIEFSLDQYDFEHVGMEIGNDFLLPGRAVARLRYIPTFEKINERIPLTIRDDGSDMEFYHNGKRFEGEVESSEDGFFGSQEIEKLVFEEVITERVPWKLFRMDPCDSWERCAWVAFGAPYTKDELIEEFGKKGVKVSVKDRDTDVANRTTEKNTAIVWEIWSKKTRKQIFIVEDHDEILEENDDPLGLEQFFPMPRPVYIVQNNDTMVPTPEFKLWQDQADELDNLTGRIDRITNAIKARGAYAGEHKQKLSQILEADDNELIPVEDWMAFAQTGGLDGVISWVPVEQFAKVLQILEAERQQKIQEIFELTGVSDILRGATDPRETAKAQQLKANFGSRRLLTKQKLIQRFFRDIFRLKAEIIAEQFDPETLRLMVGLENTENEVFMEAVAMIKSDVRRAFNVDIETNSTIAADEEKEKQGLAEAMRAIGEYGNGVFPFVQAGAIPMPVAVEMLRDYLRKFRFGRKLDDLMDEFSRQQPPSNPEQEKQNAELQAQQAEMQMKQQEHQLKMQEQQLKMQAAMQEVQMKLAALSEELGIKRQEQRQELEFKEDEHRQDLRQDEEQHEQELAQKQEMGAVERDVKRQQSQAVQSASVQ